MGKQSSVVLMSKGRQALLAPTMQLNLVHLSLRAVSFRECSKSNSPAFRPADPPRVRSYTRANGKPPVLTCRPRKGAGQPLHCNSRTGAHRASVHSQAWTVSEALPGPVGTLGLQTLPVRHMPIEHLPNCHCIHPCISLSSNRYEVPTVCQALLWAQRKPMKSLFY